MTDELQMPPIRYGRPEQSHGCNGVAEWSEPFSTTRGTVSSWMNAPASRSTGRPTEVKMTTGKDPFHYDPPPYGGQELYGTAPESTAPGNAWVPFPSAQTGGADGWPATHTSTLTAVAGPPVTWLLGAVAAGLVGAVTAGLWGNAVIVAVLAWMAAGPIGVGLIGVHSRVDTLRRAGSVYTSPLWAPVLYWTAVVVVAVGIGLAAWSLADWVGRL
jgi:hypothetical protein